MGGAGEQLPAGKFGAATIYPQNMVMVSSWGQPVATAAVKARFACLDLPAIS